MQYPHRLHQARLIKRYKRFMVDVERPDGSQLTLHCPNTGSMKNCLFPGHTVWYSDSGNHKRQYPCTWEQADVPVCFNGQPRSTRVGVNTGRANALTEELLLAGKVAQLAQYQAIRREVRYGREGSRADLLLQAADCPDCYVEVKSVTLAVGDGLGLFPDAVTTRGTKHLRELAAVCAQRHRAVLFFCVQHTGIDRVAPADAIDPDYGKALRQAVQAGVSVLAWRAALSPEAIGLVEPVTVLL